MYQLCIMQCCREALVMESMSGDINNQRECDTEGRETLRAERYPRVSRRSQPHYCRHGWSDTLWLEPLRLTTVAHYSHCDECGADRVLCGGQG